MVVCGMTLLKPPLLAAQYLIKAKDTREILKWMPRKGKHAIALEKHLGLSPKEYRKMLVEKTKVVEQLMCARDWSAITYNHVPSLAMSRYTKAFTKNDSVRFDEFKNSATTIKAGALYPYDVLKSLIVDRFELVPDPNGGRPTLEKIEGASFDLECDYLIPAVSQSADLKLLPSEWEIEMTSWSTIKTNGCPFIAGGKNVR